MIHIRNNSDTVIIVVHEIYGMNGHIRRVCDRLAEGKYDILCPNLLPGRKEPFSYKEEMTAYNFFRQKLGFSLAQQQVEELALRICKEYRYCYIVGYSIGATIAWLCSQHKGIYNGVVGFYGSRIRDYLEIVPCCPVLLFFPKVEEKFNVDFLIQNLSDKENVCATKVNAFHGFADPYSGRFCEEMDEVTFATMIDFIACKG